MRTTLTIGPDVEQLLQREMRRTDRSMKAVMNEALRRGLGAHRAPAVTRPRACPFGGRLDAATELRAVAAQRNSVSTPV